LSRVIAVIAVQYRIPQQFDIPPQQEMITPGPRQVQLRHALRKETFYTYVYSTDIFCLEIYQEIALSLSHREEAKLVCHAV
jgi:hypothetical protein